MVYPSWLCYTRHDRTSLGVLVGGYNVLTKVGSRTPSQFEQQRQRSLPGSVLSTCSIWLLRLPVIGDDWDVLGVAY